MKGLIFTYTLTYGGGFLALFNPYIGLLVYIAFSILKPEALWSWQAQQMPAYSSRIVAICLLIGWVVRGLGDWRLGRAWPIVWALLATLGWSILSTFQAMFTETAWAYVDEMLKIVLPFLVGITTIKSMKQIMLLAWVMVVSQGYVAFELNLAYLFDGVNLAANYGFGSLDNNCLSCAMNTGIGLAAFLGLSAKRWWLKLLALGCAGAMAHVVLLSFSRGGMLGLATTAVVSFLVIRKNSWHYLGFLIVLALAVRFAGPQVQERFFSTFAGGVGRDWSAQSRLALWWDCLDMLSRNPFFGVGPAHFAILSPQYGWTTGKMAHTLWLQAGAETGAPGLLFLVMFYVLTIVPLVRIVRAKDLSCDPQMRTISLMVISSLAGFVVSAQFVSMIGLETPYYVVLIGACALKLNSSAFRGQESSEESASAMLHGPGVQGLDWGAYPANVIAAPYGPRS